MILVDNSSISAAIKDVYNENRSILEPAGAVAVAGAQAYLKHNKKKVFDEWVIAPASWLNHGRQRIINYNKKDTC